MDISIIIPNYKSERYLNLCMNSLRAHLKGISHEIIIVNNDSTPITSASMRADVKIIETNANSGFAKACNIGAKMAHGDVLFFLNPDTEITLGNITDLKEKLDDPTVGIVSPILTTAEGKKQAWSAGYDITLSAIILNNVGFNRSNIFWNDGRLKTNPNWTSGAALAIKKALFKEIKGFDENFFMYFEDVDLCKRVRAEKLAVLILPSVQVKHLGGQSFSDSKLQKEYYYQSQDYYFRKHFSYLSLFLLKALRKVALSFSKVSEMK
jgi:GT2 family glycosyltransferase